MDEDPLVGWRNARLSFEALIGRGGMGAVYRGTQLQVGRTVAIKVVAPQLAADARYIERFTREARMLGRLSHPHVVTCHDFGPCQGPAGEELYVMVLEHVDGWSLARLIRDKRLTVRQVLDLHRQVAEGLHAAHLLGIVHRDVKPDNIMVTRRLEAKISDFGLARANDSVQVTQTGAIIGSPAYMAPEACRGEEPGRASDLYSLGCSLFECLCDQTPYPGATSLQVINRHISDPVPSLLDLRPDLTRLDLLLRTCLAKRPEDRPADAKALAQALQTELALLPEDLPAGRILGQGAKPAAHAAPTLLSGELPAAKRPPTVPTRPTAGLPRGPLLMAGSAALIALFTLLLSLILKPDRTPVPASASGTATGNRTTPPQAAEIDEELAPLMQRIATGYDQVEALLAEGRADQAALRLSELCRYYPPDSLSEPLRRRCQELQAKLDVQARDRLQALERSLDAVEALIARNRFDEAWKGLDALRREVFQEDSAPAARHADLLARIEKLAPRRSSERATRQVPTSLAEMAERGRLPWYAPATSTPIVASRPQAQGCVLRLSLPPEQAPGDGLLLLLASDRPCQMAITGLASGQRIPLGTQTLTEKRWLPYTVILPAGNRLDEVELSCGGDQPFWLASAALGEGGVPALRNLPLAPGTCAPFSRSLLLTLAAVRNANRDFPRPEACRAWVPESWDRDGLGRAALLAALNRSWCPPGHRLGDGTVSLHSPGGPSHLVAPRGLSFAFIGVATDQPPGPWLAALRERSRNLAEQGILPILVLGPEAIGSSHRAAWGQVLTDLRTLSIGAVPVLDLGAVPAFYPADAPLDPASPRWSEKLQAGFEAGLRQLQDRLRHLLSEAREGAGSATFPARRPGGLLRNFLEHRGRQEP